MGWYDDVGSFGSKWLLRSKALCSVRLLRNGGEELSCLPSAPLQSTGSASVSTSDRFPTSVADAIRESTRNSSAHTANSLMAATSAVGMRHYRDRGQRPRILFQSSGQRQAIQVLQSFGGDNNAIKHSDLRRCRKFRGQRSRAVPLMKLQEEERQRRIEATGGGT